jgi:predicted deacylase
MVQSMESLVVFIQVQYFVCYFDVSIESYHLSFRLVDSISVSTPTFPESVKDGTIRLLKKTGDKVSADETIAEIETDKSNLSVNTPQGGVIESFSVADGDTVKSGAEIAKLNTSGDAKSSSSIFY